MDTTDPSPLLEQPSGPACPAWFDLLVVVTTSAVLSFGGFGLLLADTGHFSARFAFPLGVLGTVAGTALGRPRGVERRVPRPPRAWIPAVGALVVALGQLAWNAKDISRHIAGDRDPGVYLQTGKWLSEHSSLIVPRNAVWQAGDGIFTVTSSGVYQMPGGTRQFQFAHMLAVLLAEANNLGGDRIMFRVPAVLGALGLCAIYAVGCRLVRRPWLVLAAVTTLAISLPDLNITRDTFSEASTQVVLWGGIYLLIRAYSTRSRSVALLAGLAIGGTVMTHIDAVIYLAPLAPLAGLAWLASRDRRSLAQVIGFALAGVVPPAVLGTFDVQHRSGYYYDDLSSEMHSLYLLLAASIVLSVIVVAAWTFVEPLRRSASSVLTRQRSRLGAIGAWVTGLGLLAAWALRPAHAMFGLTGGTATLVGSLQTSLGLPEQPGRSYAEQSLRWFEWYIGPVAVVLGVIGLCLLVVWAIRSGAAGAIVVVGLVGGIAILYLWQPNASPDQIWVTRRYATGAFPLFVLSAAVALDVGAELLARHVRITAWPRQVAAVGAAGLIAFPLATTFPVRNFHTQAGWLLAVEHACTVIGPHAAVVFPPGGDLDGATLSMTFEDWCHSPTAILTGDEPERDLRRSAADFRRQGRTLWILGYSATEITDAVPGLSPRYVAGAISRQELAKTLVSPPENYTTFTLEIYGAEIH